MNSRIYIISLAWFAFLLIAFTSGALREWLLTPEFGEHRAHQIGTVFVCILISAVIVAAIRHLRPTPGQALGIGTAWMLMTMAFEFGVFHFIVGHPMSVLLADYNLAAGRWWPLVPLTQLLTPWVAARLIAKSAARRNDESALANLPIEKPTADRPRRAEKSRLPDEFRRAISREEIADLPIRRYQGDVIVVNGAGLLAEAMLDIRQEAVLGFDTETRPAFKKGESYLPCLAQIATARAVYLLQLEQLDCARNMTEILSNPRIIKTGVAINADIGQLQRLFSFEPMAVVDIGQVAKRHGNTQSGLRNMTALFLGWRMAKGARTTNWAAAELTAAQIGYAATDAWASRELYLRFQQLGLLTATEDSARQAT